MLNFSIIILLLLIFVSKNIILLNEESLILLCFIMFCWVNFTRLRGSIITNFNEQALTIHNTLKNSFDSIVKILNLNLKQKKLTSNLITDFFLLKNHATRLNKTITSNLPLLQTRGTQKVYTQRLFFIQRLEHQTNKLVALLLIKKIEKIAFLKHCYTMEISVPNFTCNYKISLRECIEVI
uniref:ATP synthase F0 subunit b n=1 Tax=Melanthalia intermedia TaxID=172989 RepID=A0A345UBN8_9FLOR|nr:ATP synthase F0 subunit b [Melanthalia intermedia]AXI97874.1 ATP synthase F0 subunit b [Melanthalia intermedia]